MCLRKLLILGESGGENQDDSYSILNVVGADVYNMYDNNAFTNASN
jgi:trehalose/maltose hydrolase-like predicted phosphorylase